MDPPLKWVGSKRLLRKRLCALIPPDHDVYVEPFTGSAALFFFKNATRMGNVPKPSVVEVLNDIDGLLMDFYAVVQDPVMFTAFLDRLDVSLLSRDMFMAYRASAWGELDKIERAFRLYYITKVSYGGLFRFNRAGKCNSPIASSPDKKARSYLFKKDPLLAAHERLQGVNLHGWDYARVLERYDGPRAFFYIDPPYETDYAYNKPFDHRALVETLAGIQGRFVLSLNAGFESLVKGYEIEHVNVNYSVTCKTGNNQHGEIIVKNFPSPPGARDVG